MSHTLRKINLGNSALAEIVIIDYPVGGEQFTLAELGLTGALQSVLFLKTYNANPNINPVLVGGKVVLLGAETTDPHSINPEIAPTVGLNFPFVAVVHGT